MDAWKDEPKILMAYPSLGSAHGISDEWSDAKLAILTTTPNVNTFSAFGAPWDAARNNCALTMMEGGYDYLFFLDQDVVPPGDVINKLLSHKVDIIGGIYRQKIRPFHYCMFNSAVTTSGADTKTPIEPNGQAIEVDYIGAGCLLIHRSVFEKLPFPWFKWEITASNPNGKSEDFFFCDLARKNGLKVHADSSIHCDHILGAKLTINGLEPLY